MTGFKKAAPAESTTATAIEHHVTFNSPHPSALINPSSSHLQYFPQQQQQHPHHFLSPYDGPHPPAPSSSPNHNNNNIAAAAATRGRRARDTSRALGNKQHELLLNKQRRSAYLFRARERHVSRM